MACASCERDAVVMMTVEHQGQTWQICSRCYPPFKVGNIKLVEPEEPMKKGTPMGKSLITGDQYVSTGEQLRRPEERSQAKKETASFDRHPNAPEERKHPRPSGIQYVPDDDGYW